GHSGAGESGVASVTAAANIIPTIVVLLAPVGLIYGWYFFFARMWKVETGWRSHVTLVTLILISVVVVMWPIARITAPEVNWHTWVGAGAYMHWVGAWEKVSVRILLASLVLSFFGRPRLILPISFACVGIGLFWISSDIP